MGIFGFLSKAHVEQSSLSTTIGIDLSIIESEIDQQKRNISNSQKSLEELDRVVSQMDPEKAVAVRNSQKKERSFLTQEITKSSSRPSRS